MIATYDCLIFCAISEVFKVFYLLVTGNNRWFNFVVWWYEQNCHLSNTRYNESLHSYGDTQEYFTEQLIRQNQKYSLSWIIILFQNWYPKLSKEWAKLAKNMQICCTYVIHIKFESQLHLEWGLLKRKTWHIIFRNQIFLDGN